MKHIFHVNKNRFYYISFNIYVGLVTVDIDKLEFTVRLKQNGTLIQTSEVISPLFTTSNLISLSNTIIIEVLKRQVQLIY